MSEDMSGSGRIVELSNMSLVELTKIFNKLAGTPVKKLKCSKMEAALKIFKLEGGEKTYPTKETPVTEKVPLGTEPKKTRKEKLADAKAKKKNSGKKVKTEDAQDEAFAAAKKKEKLVKGEKKKLVKEKKEKPAENPKEKIPVAEMRKMGGELKVGKFCLELLKKFYPYDDILAEIAIYYPEAKTSKASLAWYKNKLNNEV